MEAVCGEMKYELVFELEDRSSLLELDTDEDLLTLSPSASALPGEYDDIVLRFYYVQYPD